MTGRKRVIPVLLLDDGGLYKTRKFKDPVYVGDPINAVKIFNEKEVDELIFLDIKASLENRPPDYDLLSMITTECFMPLCYGGGICQIDQIKKLTAIGIEKVSLNNTAVKRPDFVGAAAREFGSSTIVVSVDVARNFWGKYMVYTKNGKEKSKYSVEEFARIAENEGAGELLLNSVERDGTQSGYDIDLIQHISQLVNIPVIACGGAAGIDDIRLAFKAGASAAAAGSLFVFKGKNRAVLINYPSSIAIDHLNSEA